MGAWLIDQQAVQTILPMVNGVLNGSHNIDAAIRAFSAMDGDVNAGASEEDTEGKIAVVSMVGPVVQTTTCCTLGAIQIVEQLDKANDDPDCKGIVFIVDGPGGAVNAINPFLEFAKRKNKPVVALAANAMSLHYWTICAVADRIIGSDTISGRFGSVGVMTTFSDNRKKLKKDGITIHEIYADESDEKNKVYMEARDGNYTRLKNEQLKPIALKFRAAVTEARPNLVIAGEDDLGVLKGSTFITEIALELGMIDMIGDMEMAISVVNLLAEADLIKNQ